MSRRGKAIDQELDSVTSALVHLDRRETGLDRRLEAVEGKLRTDQVQSALDRGLPADLVSTETNVWRRLSPARNRWPEIAEFDERVAELEMRQAAKADDLRELRDREIAAPAADADRLATWQLDGEKGPRPEPELPAIRERIRERQEEWEALTRATARVLEEKTARADLFGLRRAAVWARLYPAEQSAREVADTFAGGLRRPLQAMGLAALIAPDRVLDGLRADADYLREAATPEQKVAIEGRDPRTPPNTVWDRSEEGQQWQRDQRQRALHRLRNPQ